MDESWLQEWSAEWMDFLIPGGRILLIVFLAWLAQRLLSQAVTRVAERYHMPPSMLIPLRGALRWLILGSAFLLILERLGVSANALWTAITGFAAVAAIAFFAAWSVLSNLFCATLIITVGPFRIGDTVEVLESADKLGVRGRVVAINMLYTTLEDVTVENQGALLQIPNSLFFQKVVRRWRGASGPLPPPLPPTPDTEE